LSDSDKVVEGEIVGGARSGPKRFYHPLSGVVILGVDWLAFGLDLFSGFAAIAVASLLAFLVTFYSVLTIQRRLNGDDPGAALLKALIGGLAAGMPFPVTGTILGGFIIALSGLPTFPWRKR
jgi:hypothetical protein